MDIFDATAIRQNIASLIDRAKAISKVCKDEDREPTEVEQTEIDSILNTQIPEQKKLLANAEKYEAELNNNPPAEQVGNPPVNALQRHTGEELTPEIEPEQTPLAARIVIPQNELFTTHRPRAFTGPNAREEAYIAGRFYMASLFKHGPSQEWCKDKGINYRPQSAQKGGDNALGGVLVPVELERRIIELREARGVASREADPQQMGSDVMQVPRWVSGPTAYYPAEGGAITESEVKWDNIELVAKKLAALVLVSSELNEDAMVSIGDQITRHIAYAFADAEDKALFLGDGTSTYGKQVGLANALNAGSIYTAITGNIAYGSLDLADFENMVGQLPVYGEDNAKWYIHKTGWARSMQRLADAAGGNTTETLASGMTQRMFLGYPVVFVQVMNSTVADQTSATGVCYLGDLMQGAIIGRRRGMGIAISTDFKFANDQIAIRGTQRYVVNVHSRGDASNAGAIIRMDLPGS